MTIPRTLTFSDLRRKLNNAVIEFERKNDWLDQFNAELKDRTSDPGRILVARRQNAEYTDALDDLNMARDKILAYSAALQGLAALSTVGRHTSPESRNPS